MSKIAIIGSGFSGLSAAAYLAKDGNEVHIFEKNSSIGGRARQLKTEEGFIFDMGPSWYWMPEIFERFFADFGHKVSDFYKLNLLSPAFDVVFANDNSIAIPSDFDDLIKLFESIEKGSGKNLVLFMEEAEFKYNTGMKDLIYMPGDSIVEFLDINLIMGALKLQVFTSFSKHVRKFFSHPKLIALMEFPILFLGAMPKDTPALYSLMNYAGLKLGTWYPEGGFGQVIEGMKSVCDENNVTFHHNANVEKIQIQNSLVYSIIVNGKPILFDGLIASADYEHVENNLLDKQYRNYDSEYWDKKTFAPSCLIFYLGLDKIIPNLHHHTLFFDNDLTLHAKEIYKDPKWPTDPLFYVCCPSKSDISVAPAGHENLFLLMPIAPGLKDSDEHREKYFLEMVKRIETKTGVKISDHLVYKKSYCVDDFKADYNAFKGNAYGLANTLMQTAILKPKLKNKKIKNLFYTGQLTVPGPGVPPSLISGKIAATQLQKQLKSLGHEITI